MCLKFLKKHSLHQDTIERINKLVVTGELATMEYTIAKIVKAEDNPKFFLGQFGNRKILYSCKIYIKAGINLDKYDFSRTEINEFNKSITLILPHAEILSFNMPAEEQKLEYEKVSIFRKDFTHKEKNELLIDGEIIVREEVEKRLGILNNAEQNIANIFKASLLQLGYNIVNVKFE